MLAWQQAFALPLTLVPIALVVTLHSFIMACTPIALHPEAQAGTPRHYAAGALLTTLY